MVYFFPGIALFQIAEFSCAVPRANPERIALRLTHGDIGLSQSGRYTQSALLM
ncbi:MAG: hypothetical protein N838_17350 [Thiohalocapsa sp. PB-PSB1]|nr:MAG: hypothetical protein N838_17350 [Thiohalocapsa sp. PB-PSB1]